MTTFARIFDFSHHTGLMITLRALEPEDLDLLYTIENDPSIWHVSTPAAPYSRFSLKQYIIKAGSIFETGELRLVVELHEADGSKRGIGLVDLFNFSPRDRRAEVGIAMLKGMRGKGYGGEALRLLIEHARLQLRLHSLCAYISDCGNHASALCFKNAGFKAVARLPEWHFGVDSYEDATIYHIILQKNATNVW